MSDFADLSIECPHCGKPVELTAAIRDALAAPLVDAERKKVDEEVTRRLTAEGDAIAKKAVEASEIAMGAKLRAMEVLAAEKDSKLAEAHKAELTLRQERERLELERKELDLTIQRRVDVEKKSAAEEAAAEVSKAFQLKLGDAQSALASQAAKLVEAQEAELALRRERERLVQERNEINLTIQRRVDEEKKAAVETAAAQLGQQFEARLNEAQAALSAKDAQLKVAEQAELAARKAKQEAEEAKQRTELEVVRRVDEDRAKVREQAIHERDDEYRLKLAEKEKQMAEMRSQIEDLRRKGESTSQQLTGEVTELDLIDILSTAFPGDQFERVTKGQPGGDVVQTVCNRLGQHCGKILWESKRTKTWNDPWLDKVRDDARNTKADVAAIASATLPVGIQHFDFVSGVWVTGFPTITPMAGALRQGLIETANARRAVAGTATEKELTYNYVTGPEFRQRVRGALEPVIQLRDQLDSDKRATHRRWSTQEKLLERFMINMAGMYGDLQGLVGPGLPDVDELVLLEPPGRSEPGAATAIIAAAQIEQPKPTPRDPFGLAAAFSDSKES
jgi:hypothetical protein